MFSPPAPASRHLLGLWLYAMLGLALGCAQLGSEDTSGEQNGSARPVDAHVGQGDGDLVAGSSPGMADLAGGGADVPEAGAAGSDPEEEEEGGSPSGGEVSDVDAAGGASQPPPDGGTAGEVDAAIGTAQGDLSDAGPSEDGGGSAVIAGGDDVMEGGEDSGGRGEGLDPELAPAGEFSGPVCSRVDGYPGGEDCPANRLCRFYSATESRCEAGAGLNLGAACETSAQCDILFVCFRGACTNICPLGSTYCGIPADCLDVGHPSAGVCR